MDKEHKKDWIMRANKAFVNGDIEEVEKLAKEYADNLIREDDSFYKYRKTILSEDRIKWLKDVAWNLSRITHKYDRLEIYEKLTYQELHLLCEFEHEEDLKIHEEDLKIIEEHERKYEDFRRKFEKYKRNIRQYNIEKASSSMIYLFPIGEA